MNLSPSMFAGVLAVKSLLLPAAGDMLPFLPEVIVSLTIIVALLLPVFSPKKNAIGVGIIGAVGLLLAIVALLEIDPGAAAGGYFGGLLVLDPFAWMLKLILLVFTLIVVALWSVATRETLAPGDAPEFFTLLLAATVGMMLMVSTSNLLMIFVAIEMTSLPSYVLAGFRKTHKLGAEAALKYVLFGAVSAAVMLYGMSLLYGYFGTLDLTRIATQLRDPANPFALASAKPGTPEHMKVVLELAFPILAVLLGVLFKIAAVPMHFWCPDVFEGTHIDITTYLSVASKAAGLGVLIRILMVLTGLDGAVASRLDWLAIGVTALGAITCFWGNLGALRQNNIKRMLAFSSIAHAGYMMLAAAALMAPSTAMRAPAAEAVLFYLLGYLFMNAGAFVAAAGIAQKIGSEDIRDYAGLGRRAPLLALCMLVFVFSLVGIPLTVGFAIKLKLFLVLVATPSWLAWAAIVVLGVNTVIGAFYYFRILKAMYLTSTDAEPVAGWLPTTALAALLVVPNVLLFVGYNWMDEQARTFAQVTLSTSAQAPAK